MFTKLKNFNSTKKIYNWLEFRRILVGLILILCLGIIIYINFSLFIGGIFLYLFYLWDKRENLKYEERYFLKTINLNLGDKISLHLEKIEKDGELIELGIDGFKMKLDDDSIFLASWSTLRDNKFYFIRSKEDKKSIETVRINCYLDSSENNDFLKFSEKLNIINQLKFYEDLDIYERLQENIENDSSLEGVNAIYRTSNFNKITYHAEIRVNKENYEAMSKKLNSLTWSTLDEIINDKVDSCPRTSQPNDWLYLGGVVRYQ